MIEKKDLIMKCEECWDGVITEPITMTDDWQRWAEINQPDYQYRVFKLLSNGNFILIKDYDEALEEGMALCVWKGEDTDPTSEAPEVIFKYKDLTRDNNIPFEVYDYIKKGEEMEEREMNSIKREVENCGSIGFTIGEDYYCYGEYEDNDYATAV